MLNTPIGEWEKLASSLDDDMRIIPPEIYLANQDLYDQIVGVGYLVRDLQYEDGLDWVSENQLNKLLRDRPSVVALAKVLIVRLRSPWNEINTEWLVGKEELEKDRDSLEVLETYIWAREAGTDNDPRWIWPSERQTFDENRDDYEVIETRYCVRYKYTKEQMESLLHDPYNTPVVKKDNTHTWLDI